MRNKNQTKVYHLTFEGSVKATNYRFVKKKNNKIKDFVFYYKQEFKKNKHSWITKIKLILN